MSSLHRLLVRYMALTVVHSVRSMKPRGAGAKTTLLAIEAGPQASILVVSAVVQDGVSDDRLFFL